MKERNPFSIFKNRDDANNQLPLDKFSSDIKGLLSNFDLNKYSICEFMSEVVLNFDKKDASNFEIIEFVLS